MTLASIAANQSDAPHRVDMLPLRVVRITAADVVERSEALIAAREFVLQSDELYPGIDRWFDRSVSDGVRTGSRVVAIGVRGESVVGVGILKRGPKPKLCHLNVPTRRGEPGGGSALLGDLLSDLKPTDNVVYTAAESVWCRVEDYFSGLGALNLGAAVTRYRLGEQDLVGQFRVGVALSVLRRYLSSESKRRVGATDRLSSDRESSRRAVLR